jgi:predicted RNA-binding protein YlqC (UPF0109 family)
MIEQLASARDLVEFVAKALVDQPDDVQVREVTTEQGPTIQLRVAPDDVGKVIGKHGRIIKALRTVLKAAAGQSKRRVMVEIVHEPPPRA